MSYPTNRLTGTRLQVLRSQYWRAFAFPASGRRFKPSVSRAVVDVVTDSGTEIRRIWLKSIGF